MDMIVCVKQVPDTTEIQMDPRTKTLIREGVASIVNPFDLVALEEALRIKREVGGRITVLSMGPPQAISALKECLARGADRAILLSDRIFAGSDTLATSYTISGEQCHLRRVHGCNEDLNRAVARTDTVKTKGGPRMAEKILVTVEHLKGKCRFWKEGDKIVLWRNTKTRMLGIDYKLSDGRGACLAGLMSLYPYLLGPIETWDGKTPCNRFRCPDVSDEFDGRGGIVFRVDMTGENEPVDGIDEELHLIG